MKTNYRWYWFKKKQFRTKYIQYIFEGFKGFTSRPGNSHEHDKSHNRCKYFFLNISEYYEFCLPNNTANVGLSVVDGVVCMILLILSILGIVHFCVYGFGFCFDSESEERIGTQLAVVLPGQSVGQGQIQGYYH